MEVWPQIIAGKVCRTEVLPRPRSFRRGSVPAHCRGRRPRRPVARSFHASGRDISRSGATPFCPRRQKDAKTPPKTHGLWNSFTPNVIRRKKAHRESLPLLSPLPLPRTARVACYDRLRYSAIRAAAAPVFRAAMRWFIGFAAACWHAVLQNALRSSAYFFIFRGPTGRTYTCCQRRQVRDLIIAYIGRPTDFPCPPRQRQRGQTHGQFHAEPFPAASKPAQRKSKNHWFLAALLPTFAAVGKSGSLRRAKYPRARGRGTLSAGGPQARPLSLLVIPLAADKIHIVPPVCPTRCPIGREPRHFTASRRE